MPHYNGIKQHQHCDVDAVLTPESPVHHSKLVCVDPNCECKGKFVQWLAERDYWTLYDSGIIWKP